MESIGTKTEKLPTIEPNMIPALSGSSEWFAQRNLEYLFVSGGVPFTQMSLFNPNPYKNVRNPTKIVIYFDGRKRPAFL